MSNYKFENFEVEFDPTEVSFAERYEAAAENYQNKVQTVSTDGKPSEIMKGICGIFFETFDGIFGAGTSTKMFGETLSVDLCVKAFKQLVDIMNDYGATLKEIHLVNASGSKKRSKK